MTVSGDSDIDPATMKPSLSVLDGTITFLIMQNAGEHAFETKLNLVGNHAI
jgi:hypothetical protein